MTVKLFGGLLQGQWSDHISSSQRESWMSCRLKNALRSAVGLVPIERGNGAKGMMAGSLIHSVLGQWYRTAPDERSEAKLLQIADVQARARGDDAVVGEAMSRVVLMLKLYYKRYGSDRIEPIEVEAPIERPLASGVKYIGYADMIWLEGDTLWVEDWKTSLSHIEPEAHTVFNPQGRDYLWGLSKKYDANKLAMSWLFITPASCRRVATPIGALADVGLELDAIAVEQRTLSPEPNYAKHCLWCEYKPICRTKVTGGDVSEALKAYKIVKEEPRNGDEPE